MKENNKSSGVDLYSIDVGVIGVYIFKEPPFKDYNMKESEHHRVYQITCE